MPNPVERNVAVRARTTIMRTYASLLVAVLAILLSLVRQAAAAAPDAVIVVDIQGEIDDPEALRSAIGKELGAEAVTRGDARAAAARGTLTIEARGEDRQISATYRGLGAPVERTVELPSDPKHARSVAIVLAGNVAREEANELLSGMKKAPVSSHPAPDVTLDRDEEQLRQARLCLTHR